MLENIFIHVGEKKDFLELEQHVNPSHIVIFQEDKATSVNLTDTATFTLAKRKTTGTVAELSDNLFPNCNDIIIEYPYIDNEYLSNFFIYYSQKYKEFPKKCYRLLLVSTENETRKLIGYITLTPSYSKNHLGRIFIEPKYLIKEKAKMILAQYKVHYNGKEISLRVFPELRQEGGGVCVCGHVAAWDILKFFSNRFRQYSEKTIGDIAKTTQHSYETVIHSGGVTIGQMRNLFLQFGFSPIWHKNNDSNFFMDEILTYIESGVPVLGIMKSMRHAVSIVGRGTYSRITGDHGIVSLNTATECAMYNSNFSFVSEENDQNKEIKNTGVLYSTSLVQTIYVNDDNFFPYRAVPRELSDVDLPYSFESFTSSIIPLYAKIHVGYNNVRTIFEKSVHTFITEYGWNAVQTAENADQRIVARMFFTSANTYREYLQMVIENSRANTKTKSICNLLLKTEMSKFIWVIETSTFEEFDNGEISGLCAIDSTSSVRDVSPFLFVVGNEKLTYFNENLMRDVLLIPLFNETDNFNMARFDMNLEEVNPI